MPNDLTCILYIERARIELDKGEQWMRISPRLALEVFQELLAARNADVADLTALLSTVRHNLDTQKS